MKLEDFFNQEVPQYLKKLKPNTVPRWGQMNAAQMLDHLRQGVALSMDDSPRKIKTPDEQLPAYRKFLLSDKPFPQGRPKPPEYDKYQWEENDFMQKKVELMRDLIAMQVFFKKEPHHSSVHPSFGKLSTQEWLHLHHKHFWHHFKQFNLLEE